jgi:CHAD domain-containing protein
VGELAVTVVKSQVQNTEQQLSTLLSRQQVDAEVIHDVRVELRRLRNGLATVAPVLALPPLGSTEAGLTHALKLLGRPRDLDVLTELLQTAATRSLDERAATALSSHTKRMVRARLTVARRGGSDSEELTHREAVQHTPTPRASLTAGVRRQTVRVLPQL